MLSQSYFRVYEKIFILQQRMHKTIVLKSFRKHVHQQSLQPVSQKKIMYGQCINQQLCLIQWETSYDKATFKSTCLNKSDYDYVQSTCLSNNYVTISQKIYAGKSCIKEEFWNQSEDDMQEISFRI